MRECKGGNAGDVKNSQPLRMSGLEAQGGPQPLTSSTPRYGEKILIIRKDMTGQNDACGMGEASRNRADEYGQ